MPAALLIVAPDGTISFANTGLEQLTGYRRPQLLGLPVEALEPEARRSARAVHDPLTGPANRVLLLDRLTVALARADRQARGLGVLYVDLDGFKAVNDRWRHAVGDEVLRTVAQRLTAAVRPQDTVARIGGDEFVVLCGDLTGDDDASEVAERALEALRRPIPHRAGICQLAASIGVVPGGGERDPAELIEAADRAMYRAKRRGGASIELVDIGRRSL